MIRTFLTTGAIALGMATTTATPASAGHGVWDRIEDRIDRRESRIDRQTDNGRLDRLEDRIDRREDRRDRAGLPTPRFVSRWERRSWHRTWGN